MIFCTDGHSRSFETMEEFLRHRRVEHYHDMPPSYRLIEKPTTQPTEDKESDSAYQQGE